MWDKTTRSHDLNLFFSSAAGFTIISRMLLLLLPFYVEQTAEEFLPHRGQWLYHRRALDIILDRNRARGVILSTIGLGK